MNKEKGWLIPRQPTCPLPNNHNEKTLMGYKALRLNVEGWSIPSPNSGSSRQGLLRRTFVDKGKVLQF
jgi:hypothetical protein